MITEHCVYCIYFQYGVINMKYGKSSTENYCVPVLSTSSYKCATVYIVYHCLVSILLCSIVNFLNSGECSQLKFLLIMTVCLCVRLQ